MIQKIEPLSLELLKKETIINLDELEKHRIKPTDILPPPEIAIKIYNDENPDNYGILGTLGNFSTFIGKAKAKKTFFLSIAIASAITDKAIFKTFEGCLKSHHNNVLYFDTEQSKYHVHLALKRICKMAGIKDPENIYVYGLRPEDTETRLAFIEKKIYETENLGFVVIDGIRDLVYDINCAKESSAIAGKLLKWSEERNIHIVTVLHQNKGDGNARGHLGTELVNKSETVLAVEKKDNSSISVVNAIQCRNKEPEPFAFEIDEDGIPFKVDVPKSGDKGKQKFSVEDIELSKIWELIQNIFSERETIAPLTDGIMRQEIKKFAKGFFPEKENLTDADVNKILITAKSTQMIRQEKNRHPFSLGKYL